jgi:hypothetical protein
MVWSCEQNGCNKNTKKDIKIKIYGHVWGGRNNTVQPDTESHKDEKSGKTSRMKGYRRKDETGDFSSIDPYKTETTLEERYKRVITLRQIWHLRFLSYIGPIGNKIPLPFPRFVHTQHQLVSCGSDVRLNPLVLQLQMGIFCQSPMLDEYRRLAE